MKQDTIKVNQYKVKPKQDHKDFGYKCGNMHNEKHELESIHKKL